MRTVVDACDRGSCGVRAWKIVHPQLQTFVVGQIQIDPYPLSFNFSYCEAMLNCTPHVIGLTWLLFLFCSVSFSFLLIRSSKDRIDIGPPSYNKLRGPLSPIPEIAPSSSRENSTRMGRFKRVNFSRFRARLHFPLSNFPAGALLSFLRLPVPAWASASRSGRLRNGVVFARADDSCRRQALGAQIAACRLLSSDSTNCVFPFNQPPVSGLNKPGGLSPDRMCFIYSSL